MFDLDKWQEIWNTIQKNKLRTLITAFNVSWGIFILIILIGFGNGFHHGVEQQFDDDATNSLWIRPGQTSMAYKGLKPGKKITFTNTDYTDILANIDGVEHLTGRYYVSGEFTVRYKDRYSSFNIRACHPDHLYLEKTILTAGRFINPMDLKQKRKVTAIGTKVVDILFGKEDPIGKYITVNGIQYKVVGVYKDEGNENEMKVIYIPISTAQIAYGGGNQIHQLMLTMGKASVGESKEIEASVLTLLSDNHIFSKEDKKAVNIGNSLENFQQFMDLFAAIKVFLFIVGIFTLVAGVVGLSNIMLIVVKERTKEVGIRKAIGATPNSVVGLFLQEALIITLVAGYVGLVAGIFFIEYGFLADLMALFGFPMDFFTRPSVSLQVAITATIVLVLAGCLAGYFPARKAAKISPIEALKDE